MGFTDVMRKIRREVTHKLRNIPAPGTGVATQIGIFSLPSDARLGRQTDVEIIEASI